jgi:outer membrane lipoprotein-sorting protein
MKYTSKIALACAVIAAVAGVFSVVRARQVLTPEQILLQTTKAYAGSKSYRDSGTSKSSSPFGNMGTLSTEGQFTTAFVRPDNFRWEFKGKMTRPHRGEYISREIHFIVWRRGADTYQYRSTRKVIEKTQSLAMAVAGATGFSGGLSTITADMLLPDESIGLPKITDFKEVKRLGDAKVGETDCFCIQGKMADTSTTVWIDKQTFLIRRLNWNWDGRKHTTIWKPAIDEEIADEALEFNAPQQ